MINARINDTIRKMLLGQSTDLDDHYYCPKEDDLLSEYLKVVDALTINEENRLRRKVAELTPQADVIKTMQEQLRLLFEKQEQEKKRSGS
jgi:hypothetical protein